MLGKLSKPVIGILTGSLIPGGGQMDSKVQSPRGIKNLDLGDVGLGIVAALEKSGSGQDGVSALFGRNLTRSSPTSVNSPKNCWRCRREAEETTEMESLEEHTIVTCHGPNKSYTKVYSDVAESERKGDDRATFRIAKRAAAPPFSTYLQRDARRSVEFRRQIFLARALILKNYGCLRD